MLVLNTAPLVTPIVQLNDNDKQIGQALEMSTRPQSVKQLLDVLKYTNIRSDFNPPMTHAECLTSLQRLILVDNAKQSGIDAKGNTTYRLAR